MTVPAHGRGLVPLLLFGLATAPACLADAPLAATVLGEEVRTDDAREMQSVVLERLFEAYREERGIEADAEEIDAFVAHLRRTMEADGEARRSRVAELEQRLASETLGDGERATLEKQLSLDREILASGDPEADLSPEEREHVAAMRQAMARAMIVRWKVNRALHAQYGGRTIFQQAGPEPLDAYRAFLEERQRAGDFTIHRADFAPEFWRYFTDESMHSFFEPGSEEAARLWDVPPWEDDAS